jgi:pimeloyl-ACP methyl ester carboxylesterase
MSRPDHEFRAQPTDGSVDGAGLRIHYLDWGPAPAPTIVFLHGGGLNAHTWDVVCDVLRPGARCVAIDLRGHGDSDWADDGNYTLRAHAEDLEAVISALRLDRIVVVGMSLGGSVGLTYAAEHPTTVVGLVLVDVGPGGSRPDGNRRLGAFMRGPSEFASVDELVERAIAFNPRRSPERLRRTLLNNLRQTTRGTWTWKYDPRFPSRAHDPSVPREERVRLLAERRAALWAAAAAVPCPVLVVRGGASDMFLDEDAEQTAAGFADARWIRIEGASHTVQSDRPYELADALRSFVSGLGAGDEAGPASG